MSLAIINVLGNWTGDVVLPVTANDISANATLSPATNQTASNTLTGANSNNSATTSSDTQNTLNVTNNSNVTNALQESAITGGNTASDNTVGGNVSTGLADLQNNILNLANLNVVGDTWYLAIVNFWNQWTGLIALPGSQETLPGGSVVSSDTLQAINAATGLGSNNLATAASSSTNTTNITQNGTINNQIALSATTGNNTATANTEGGNITTGAAQVGANIMNFVNSTFNVKHWYVVIVNVLGSWNGGIRASDQPQIGLVGGRGGGSPLAALAPFAAVTGTFANSGSAFTIGTTPASTANTNDNSLQASSSTHSSSLVSAATTSGQPPSNPQSNSSRLFQAAWFATWMAAIALFLAFTRRPKTLGKKF
jgi:hypothetical protein